MGIPILKNQNGDHRFWNGDCIGMNAHVEMGITKLKNLNADHCFEMGIANAWIPISKWKSPYQNGDLYITVLK